MAKEKKITITIDEQGYFSMHAEGVGPLEIFTACHFVALQAEETVKAMMFGGNPKLLRPNLREIEKDLRRGQ